MTAPSIDPKVLGEYDPAKLAELIAAIEEMAQWVGGGINGEYDAAATSWNNMRSRLRATLPTLLALQAAVSAPVARFTIEEVLDIVRKSEGMLVTINEHGHTHFVSGKGLARHIKPMLESAQPVIIIATEGK